MEKGENQMVLLEQRTYSRTELEELFFTNRTDSIKRSLSRAGYCFESAGRGKNFTISITALPQPTPFKEFAEREFACGPQTNFEAMETFFSLLLFHSEFRYFPATYQA